MQNLTICLSAICLAWTPGVLAILLPHGISAFRDTSSRAYILAWATCCVITGLLHFL